MCQLCVGSYRETFKHFIFIFNLYNSVVPAKQSVAKVTLTGLHTENGA